MIAVVVILGGCCLRPFRHNPYKQPAGVYITVTPDGAGWREERMRGAGSAAHIAEARTGLGADAVVELIIVAKKRPTFVRARAPGADAGPGGGAFWQRMTDTLEMVRGFTRGGTGNDASDELTFVCQPVCHARYKLDIRADQILFVGPALVPELEGIEDLPIHIQFDYRVRVLFSNYCGTATSCAPASVQPLIRQFTWPAAAYTLVSETARAPLRIISADADMDGHPAALRRLKRAGEAIARERGGLSAARPLSIFIVPADAAAEGAMADAGVPDPYFIPEPPYIVISTPVLLKAIQNNQLEPLFRSSYDDK